MNHGRLNGFVIQEEKSRRAFCSGYVWRNPECAQAKTEDVKADVMGYHNGSDIPNYWAYASNYVLQDHMFAAVRSWSLPAHLYLVSGWSATCSRKGHPSSCRNQIEFPARSNPTTRPAAATTANRVDYAWTDLTYMLHKHHVPWAYYVNPGTQPDCADSDMLCGAVAQGPRTPNIWNPLPCFDTISQDHQLGNVKGVTSFYASARQGTLPAVWSGDPQREKQRAPTGLGFGRTELRY